MLCCIGELICLIFGIIALVKGEFKLSANRVVRSGPARLIGVLLLLPLLFGTGGEAVFGGLLAARAIQQGKQFDPQDVKGATPTLLLIHGLGGGLPLLIALIVALATASPPRRPRRDDYDDDDYDDDDRPRRRRPRDGEGEDEDGDDDRPRRRRDDDDKADEHIKER
jgi:hypothetical protein